MPVSEKEACDFEYSFSDSMIYNNLLRLTVSLQGLPPRNAVKDIYADIHEDKKWSFRKKTHTR
jgi:hypothetical protein